MIIDMHIHVFADQIAPRALSKLAATAGLTPTTDLTASDTRRKLARWGIDYGVVMPIATKPSQQATINDWAESVQGGPLISFGSVFPSDPSAFSEVDHVKSNGLRGIKLHPDYQGYLADDRKVYPVYEKISEAQLPVLFHAGWDPVSPDKIHCAPKMLRRVQDQFPELKIIGAHMGGNRMYDDVEEYLVGSPVYIDISLAPQFCTFDQFERIIRNHDPERVLFGTDTPWSSVEETLEWVERLHLPADRRDRLLWKNASELLGLERIPSYADPSSSGPPKRTPGSDVKDGR